MPEKKQVLVFVLETVFAVCYLLTPCAVIVLGMWSHRRYGPVLDVFVPTAVNVVNGTQVLMLILRAVLCRGAEWFLSLSWLLLLNLALVVLYGIFVLVLNVAQRGSLSRLLLVYQVVTWLWCVILFSQFSRLW